MKSKKNSQNISRLNSLWEAVRSSPDRINKILIQREKRQKKIGEIIRLAQANHIPVLFVPKQSLDRLDSRHQGAVGILAAKSYTPLASIFSSSSVPFLVLLDGIEDPQNLGAIIRTAEGAGADGLVLPERRAAGVTEAVSRVSAGAVEHVKIARVKNLARALDDLKEKGVWLVGAEGGGREYWYEFDYNLPVGLVFGSEGRGLRPVIKKRCDKILSIPLLGRLASLNVASAASVFLYEVVRQRRKV
ncbi:MAG: 23S rRNA (guanosine(2251)-2'-O)-methyltransferase RlmB [Candidatus Aminicenantes bacterium]